MATIDALMNRLRSGSSSNEARWTAEAMTQAKEGTREQLLQVYTAASRHLGVRTLEPIDDDGLPVELSAFGIDWWTLEDIGRALCLLARHDGTVDKDGFVDDAVACFEQGDTREQHSWLRAVGVLPGAERFLPVVIDACRTNILTLFEAVACENPYPARHFPEANFNQLVLKALFSGVALARIVDLPARANPELTRMSADFANERRAAGRQVPPDIALAMTAR